MVQELQGTQSREREGSGLRAQALGFRVEGLGLQGFGVDAFEVQECRVTGI